MAVNLLSHAKLDVSIQFAFKGVDKWAVQADFRWAAPGGWTIPLQTVI